MGNASSGGFAFEIGERISYEGPATYWQLHAGKRKIGGEPVSIFKIDKVSASRLKVEAGMHGLQKMKTVRHPYILQYIDGADLEKEMVLVTEPVVPLREWLSAVKAETKDQQIAWGLRCLASALDFLNANNQMTHGMVCNHSVFVTRSGDWKLGGLDLLCEWKADGKDILHFQLHESLVASEYRAPERRNNSMEQMMKGRPGAMDMWALGALLDEINGGRPTGGALANIQRRLMADNPSERPSAAQLLKHSFLQNKELINILRFLETFSLKEDAEKVHFFQMLYQQINRLPPEVGVYKILPTFRDYVHIENGQASSTGGQPAQRHLLLAALPVCLEILKSLDAQTFSEMGENLVASLFTLNDRALRAALLQNLQFFSDKMSEANVNGRVFDSILTGFSDSAPQLRELTLKSMLCLSPRLFEKNLNDRLMRSLAKLHSDPEPSIRTNTTIFLGRIAAQLKEGSRSRVLLPAFLKACRDPFPHARLAGLKAAAACTAYFDIVSISTKVLPTVCLLLIDPDTTVRDAAFQCHDAYMKVLIVNAGQLKEVEEKRRSELADKGELPPSHANLGGDGMMAGALGSLAQATSSVAAWGAQKVLASTASSIEIDQQPLVEEPLSSVGGVVSMEPNRSALSTSSSSSSSSSSSKRREEEDEEDFFDVVGPAGSSTKPQPSDGWGGDERGDLDVSPHKALSVSLGAGGGRPAATSTKRSPLALSKDGVGSTLLSSSSGSLKVDGLRLSKKGVAPLSSDDLFSMLNKASSTAKLTTPSTFTTKPPLINTATGGLSTSLFSSDAKAATPLGGSGSNGMATTNTAASRRSNKSRLQAKKLEVGSSEWDDF